MAYLKPALQASTGRSRDWGGASLVNCFAEKADGDKRADLAVMATPGLTTWATVGNGPFRGALVLEGVLYVVSGGYLYSVDSSGASTQLGGIGDNGPVRIASNYAELCIAAGGTGYVYSGGGIAQPVPFSVSDVIYADGYILWVIEDAEQFIISALDDALTYDAADIASVEGAPDNVVGVVSDHREIQFFGETSTEIYYNSGDASFPFERQGNAFIERGCFDRDSIVKIDNSVTFVGNDRIVYTLEGYQPRRISTHAIEYQLRDATFANAWTYTQEGHKFYVLDCDNGTFLFDQATGAWHQRQSDGATNWRCNGAVEAYGRLILGDRDTGRLFIPSPDVFDEAGQPIAFELTLPAIEPVRERRTMASFEVVIEAGVGNDAVSAPSIMLTYSDDGGHSWSNEMWRGMGAVGEHRTRAVWRKLGQFRNRQMRLRITDSVRRLVIAYNAEFA